MYYAVDFETYYDDEYTLKKLDPITYSRHDSFDPYLVSIFGPDLSFVGHPSDAPWDRIPETATLVAHNASFDSAVYKVAKEKKIIHDKRNREWVCSADLAAYCQYPRHLKGAAKQVLGESVSKGIREFMLKKDYVDLDEETRKKVDEYALNDSRLCFELWNKIGPDWPDDERHISKLNREAGHRGVALNMDLLNSGLESLEVKRFRAESHIPWDWEGNKTPLSFNKIREQCRKDGIRMPSSLAQDSEECSQWEDKYSDSFPWIQAIRDWRRSNMMINKLSTMQIRGEYSDGVMPFGIKYFGAHTGRFSGDSGFNMQNLPRGDIFGVDIRPMLVPRPGKTFLIFDYSQIEARLLLWCARDWKTLELVKSGINVYEAHARATMGWTGGTLKKENPALYNLAKARVLACGYGIGLNGLRFQVMAKIYAGMDLDLKEAGRIVSEYRASNPLITQLWGRLQRSMAWSHSQKENFEIVLPSGRKLVYSDILSEDGFKARVFAGGPRRHFFGGKITENLIQAIARDVLTDGWLALDKAGFNVLFTVHDEFILEVDQDNAEDSLGEVSQILSVPPAWLQGQCPIGCEGEIKPHYTKA